MFRKTISVTILLLILVTTAYSAFDLPSARTEMIEPSGRSSFQLGAGEATIYVQPSNNQFLSPPTMVNDSFTVTVRIANFTHVAGWQVKVLFVKAHLYTNVGNVTYATGFIFPPGFYPPIPSVVGDHNSTHDYIMMTTTTYGAIEYSGTDAGLVRINFFASNLPAPGVTWLSLIYLEHIDTWTIDQDLNENAEILIHGHYQIERLPEPDIAVTGIEFLPMQLIRGGILNINVTVLNEGNCTVTLSLYTYGNTTLIGSKTITLENGNSTVVTFTWSTAQKALGNYLISAYAQPVPYETDVADNYLEGGWFLLTALGDINGDFKVDGKDIAIVAKAYNTQPDDPLWDPRADINGDLKVDGKDVAVVAKDYDT